LLQIVAEGELSPTRLGIWTVDTFLDGRGPIKMLVDTGATSTFLSWKGLHQLGLSSRDNDSGSSLVKELTQQTGAMGADNIAMSLTHRLEVKHSVNFGRRKRRGKYDGVPIGNNNHNNHHKESKQQPCVLSIDIGDIAILETQLAADNVAGIMGMDVFSQCSVMRMTFTGPIPRITLFNQKQQQQQQQQHNRDTNTNTNISSSNKNSTDENKMNDLNLNSNPTSTTTKEATPSATTSATTSSLFKRQRQPQQQQKQNDSSGSDRDSDSNADSNNNNNNNNKDDEKTMSSMEEEQKKSRKKKKKKRRP